MAKGKKRKASIGENVDSYGHEQETCKNAVPVGLASYDTLKSKPMKYEYDPHLDSHFFVGTVLAHGTWVILGVFWPKKKINER